jgi:glycosyltransferase involved in cell wall biosynthesis
VSDAVRLAVDAREVVSDTRGIGRYERAILPRLARRDDFEITLLLSGPLRARRDAFTAMLGTDRFRMASDARDCEVLWHPANGTFFSSHIPNVATIHGAAPFRFPDKNPRRRKHQQEPFFRSVQRARKIIAVSNFNRDELIDVFGVNPERIDVIYHGVDPLFAPRPASYDDLPAVLRRPYFLFVGDPIAEEAKNFATLYQAYREAFNASSGPALAIVGRTDPKLHGVTYAGHAGGDSHGDMLLRALYSNALAVCIPSYYETFGMPMLEAMACGTPVIAADATCLPEVGGRAALYAPPMDTGAWARALGAIAADSTLRSRLRAAGLARAAAFDWDESARRHGDIFLSLCPAYT